MEQTTWKSLMQRQSRKMPPDAGEETSDVSEQGEENEAEVIEEQPEEQVPELADVIEELTDAVEEVADALTDEQPEEEKEDV